MTGDAESPICIVGMHRSGTSMVSRLLGECGIYLGTPEGLAIRNAFNADGYWEDPRFVAINERLLTRSGADWDFPVPISPAVSELERSRATLLAAEFARRGTWGWKDPRSSLTLPFWKSLFPSLRAVLCVRHPIEVAWSLRHRNLLSPTFGVNLWQEYNRRILDAVGPGERVVTHYDAYFVDPLAELHRVVELLGLSIPEERIANAAATVKTEHRHHRFTSDQLAEVSVTPEVLESYLSLCEEAGWDDTTRSRWNHAVRTRPLPVAEASPWSGRRGALVDVTALDLEAALGSNRWLQAEIERIRQEAQLQRAQLSEQHRTELAQRSDQLRSELQAKAIELEAARASAKAIAEELGTAQREWEHIRSGFGWTLLESLWRSRARLLPHGSVRDDVVQSSLRIARRLRARLRP